MNKKSKVLIVIICILLLVFGIFLYQNQTVKKINVGDTQFSIPSGYNEQVISKSLVKFTSGNNVFYINEKNSTDINHFVNLYVNHKNKTENKSVEISQFQSNGQNIYKSVVSDNVSVVHYWFLKNGKCYEIYTGTADSNMDNLISDIVKS